MRLQSRHRTYSFVAALSAIVLTNPAPANDGSDLYDTIMRAWHLRQQKVQNARFQLSCVHTFHEGSLDRFRQVATGKAPTGAPDPPHDIQAEYEESVSIRGNKMRLTSDLPRWDPDLKGLRPEHNEAAFDGSLFKSLRKTASAKQSYPLGVVKKSARSESAEQYSMLPLLLSVLSEDEPIARDLARYEVTGKSVKVSGRPCVELAAISRVQDRRDLLYLDSERDYVVVRKATIVNGVTTWQLDVQNGPDATVG